MDESCSIQAPSSSCIKKNETTEVVSQKSNFEGSPHSGCLFSFYYYDMQKTMSTSYSQYLQSYKGNVEYDRETEND